jgi:ATP-dependent helicase HrpB
MPDLPIEKIKTSFLVEVDTQNIVVSSSTGSGKSTRIPVWLQHRGSVLVIQPRRVACQSLAARIAETEGFSVGREIGYRIRGEDRSSSDTKILFATTGVALRMASRGSTNPERSWHQYSCIIFDEFHERNLDMDLLVALAIKQGKKICVLSATIDGDAIAKHLNGIHLRAEGRTYPVSILHSGNNSTPTIDDLPQRILHCLDKINTGDVLVFLPGKREIQSLQNALRHREESVLPMHGSLSMKEQKRVFIPSKTRRIILSTNVAETSITIPNISTVIDSGLERRNRYHRGRGYLTLFPIAQDSADQRSGRAGRLQHGTCYRLWSNDRKLLSHTPPEIYRESLDFMILSAAGCGFPLLNLPFLSPPKEYAVKEGRENLLRIGAIDSQHSITPRGQHLLRLPLDIQLGRLLIEAQQHSLLPAILPLCAGLHIHQTLFSDKDTDQQCDAIRIIKAILGEIDDQTNLAAFNDIQKTLRELRGTWATENLHSMDRKKIALCIMKAWPRSIHIVRRRRGRVSWSNGGTEKSLSKHSIVNPEKNDALLALNSIPLGKSARQLEEIITVAMPIKSEWILEVNQGRQTIVDTNFKKKRWLCTIQVRYANSLIAEYQAPPPTEFIHEAIWQAFEKKQFLATFHKAFNQRHKRQALYHQVIGDYNFPDRKTYFLETLSSIGIEELSDLQLINGEEILPEELDPLKKEDIIDRFPEGFSTGDATYKIEYRIEKNEAVFLQVAGHRKTPPNEIYWPRLPGWKIFWRFKNRERKLR